MAWIYKPSKKRTKTVNVEKRQEIYNTSLWHRMRLAKLREDPLCEICLMEGRTTLADQVHHLRSFLEAENLEERDKLAFDSNNFCSICQECHNMIHNGDLRGCKSLDQIKDRLEQLKDTDKK